LIWSEISKEGGRSMDAKELTIRYNELRNEYLETKKTVDYLEQEVSKLRLLVDDMKYDLMDVQRSVNK
jgi:hypothetical protein